LQLMVEKPPPPHWYHDARQACQRCGQQVRRVEVGTPMTSVEAVLLGVMLALTPSMVLLALLLCRDGISSRVESKLDRQPPYASPNSPIQLTIEMTAVARNVAFIMDRRIFLTCGVSHCWSVGIA
jgi:hypothetical protein